MTQPGNIGGIDFDFGAAAPNAWHLREFLIKQFNAGALDKSIYRPLLQDPDRFFAAAASVLTHFESSP